MTIPSFFTNIIAFNFRYQTNMSKINFSFSIFFQKLKNNFGIIPFLFVFKPRQITVGNFPNHFFGWYKFAYNKIYKRRFPKRDCEFIIQLLSTVQKIFSPPKVYLTDFIYCFFWGSINNYGFVIIFVFHFYSISIVSQRKITYSK